MTMKRFTFAEVLAAMLLAAIVLPVAIAGINSALQALHHSRMQAEGRILAAAKLNEVIVTGDWSEGDDTGDFGDTHPEWTWEVTVADWSEDDSYTTEMSSVKVKVMRTVADEELSVELVTLAASSTSQGGSQ